MMNQIFSPKRFIQLVLSHWTENKKRYLLFVVAMIALLIFGAICLLSVDGARSADEDVQYATFMFALMVAGCIFSGTFLSNLNDKSKGITYILLPASALEKLLCTLLFTIPFFVIVYIACFYLIDIPFVAICNSIKYEEFLLNQKNGNNYDSVFYPHKVISLLHDVKRANNYNNWDQEFYFFRQFFYMFFGLQAFFLMGSAYFKKFAFVKTLLSGFVLCLFFSVITLLIYKHHTSMNVFENYFRKKPIVDKYYYYAAFIVWFFKLGMGCLFYIATYFHIKEKEI